MEAAVIEIDDSVFAVIEYALIRQGIDVYRVKDTASFPTQCPVLLLIDTAHTLYTQETVNFFRQNCEATKIMAMDAMHGFIVYDVQPDVTLKKPFSAKEFIQTVEQILAI